MDRKVQREEALKPDVRDLAHRRLFVSPVQYVHINIMKSRPSLEEGGQETAR